MSDPVVTTISLILAAVFAWAAIAKALRFSDWRAVLVGYRLPGLVARVSSWTVPLAELFVVGLILAGETKAGSALSLMLLSSFSLALVRARALQGVRLPCGCFGARKERDYRLLLARNGSLAVLPAALLLGGHDLTPLSGLVSPSAGDVLPTLLALVGILLALWTAREVAGAVKKGRS